MFFYKKVWTEIEAKLRCLNFWYSTSLLECAKNWVLKADSRVVNIRLVVNEHIDKSSSWAYFDGSVAGVP